MTEASTTKQITEVAMELLLRASSVQLIDKVGVNKTVTLANRLLLGCGCVAREYKRAIDQYEPHSWRLKGSVA